MHRVPVSLVLLIAAAAASTANMPPSAHAATAAGAGETDNEAIDSPLDIINPWLSACDLAQPAIAPDLQGTCSTATPMPASLWINEGPGPPGPSTRAEGKDDEEQQQQQQQNNVHHQKESPPTPCSPSSAPRNASTTSNQCLYYLEESHKQMVCKEGQTRAWRRERLTELRLKHCREHSVYSSLADHLLEAVLDGGDQCRNKITALLDTDALAARITCEFMEVLTRYDCGQPYSVYRCDHCKEAYRRWVCSSLVPHFISSNNTSRHNNSNTRNSMATRTSAAPVHNWKGDGVGRNGTRRVRPCRSVCQTVEQRCPYMLPGDRAPAHPTQYAGEPTFLCLDPNIPETGEQALKSSHGSDDCCYTYCEMGVCAKCLETAAPDVSTILNESSWRVRCTTVTNPVPAGATSAAGSSSGDMRASNCPPNTQQQTTVMVTAQQRPPDDSEANAQASAAVTSHAQAQFLKTIQITIIFAVAWTAVWTNNNQQLLVVVTETIIINTTFVIIHRLYGLLLIFVNSGYQLLIKQITNIFNILLIVRVYHAPPHKSGVVESVTLTSEHNSIVKSAPAAANNISSFTFTKKCS